MAVGFRQRLAALAVPRKELLHSRSAGHPVATDLHNSVNALLAWTQAPAQEVCTAWIGAGMDLLGKLLSALTDLLYHPEVQDPARRRCNTASSSWTERLLRDLVLLADAHDCFCDVLVSLKQLLGEAQAAVRYLDAARLAAALRAPRRSDRALSRLASTLRTLSHRRSSSSPAAAMSGSGEAALTEAVAAATCAAAAASSTIFTGLASASASSTLRAMTSPTDGSPEEAIERLQRLENRIVAAEDGCQQVHRALVNTRMSLLNLLTPC